MKIDFNQKLKSFDGTVINTQEADGKKKELTLGWACCTALMANSQDDKAAPNEKMNRFFLAQKIHAGELANAELDLRVEEVVNLKTLIGKCFGTAVIGSAYVLLDSAERTEGDEIVPKLMELKKKEGE